MTLSDPRVRLIVSTPHGQLELSLADCIALAEVARMFLRSSLVRVGARSR